MVLRWDYIIVAVTIHSGPGPPLRHTDLRAVKVKTNDGIHEKADSDAPLMIYRESTWPVHRRSAQKNQKLLSSDTGGRDLKTS